MMNTKKKFMLENRKWYALQFLDLEHFSFSNKARFSPIRIDKIKPLKTGKSIFILSFYHMNYPEGVNEKKYKLQTLIHNKNFIIAKQINSDALKENNKILYIHDIDLKWIHLIWGKDFIINQRELENQISSTR